MRDFGKEPKNKLMRALPPEPKVDNIILVGELDMGLKNPTLRSRVLFGVISSLDSNIAYDSMGKHVLAPALEKVGIWHVRQGICTKTLTLSSSRDRPSLVVTSIASSASSLVL